MESLDQALCRALDFALQSDLEQAQTVLDERDEPSALQLATYFKQQQLRARDRARFMARGRHECGNALSIAQASIEAMLDGIVSITDPRLNRIRDILAGVSASMYDLTAEGSQNESDVPAEDPIVLEVDALAALAQMNGVRLSYECAADAPTLRALRRNSGAQQAARTMLLTALRRTRSGGQIQIERNSDGDLLWNIDSAAASEVLRAAAGMAQILADNGSETTLLFTEGI